MCFFSTVLLDSINMGDLAIFEEADNGSDIIKVWNPERGRGVAGQ